MAMNSNIDEAKKLADEFKREGYFDKLKQKILSQELNNGEAETTIEQIIRHKVDTIVKGMVADDENLVFKNRGSTSALIESQLFKDNYKKLSEGNGALNVDEYIQEQLNDKLLRSHIKEKLEALANNNESNE
ncbi:hypothetical protein HG536_0F02270 [Torulaspora globosa]|uniref:BOD1/SHG1 domain-containing protein n=1 Tax=Torulaspora globosa TaxID=48254 RepID=A0A7G3ZK66_9SACH|nr:uncharacterized protein HG536_0F02270 [Torulaspora globosa]QLL33902.1 hypothetical protein HG536_0F02270 [Torulaspora globosa]